MSTGAGIAWILVPVGPGTGVSYDGRMATSYDAGRELAPHAEEAWHETVAPFVGPGATVLDVGAGTGRFAGLFATRFAAEVIAVEPAQGMRAIGQAKQLGSSVRWIAGQAEALPLRDRTADVLWLCCVLHYLDLPVAAAEFSRVLRSGGHLLVRSVFPDRFDDLVWLRWFPTARAIDEARMPSVEAVTDALAASGLRLRERIPSEHLAASDLTDLARRLEHRAISTLELISDDEFAQGLAALRADAASTRTEPVYSPIDVLVFSHAEENARPLLGTAH